MNFKDIRNTAIELYQKGVTIKEINKKIGIDFTEDDIQKWVREDKIRSYTSNIVKLQKSQKTEKDKNERRKILQQLKEKLEKALEIVPNDIYMQTQLMYTNISLQNIEEARTIGYRLLEQVDSKELLNGLSIVEEKSKNYEKAIQMIDRILNREPNNEYYKSKKQRLQNKRDNKANDEKHNLYAQ